MLDRETGFEATQASVPLSRSPTIRLIAAKIATNTKICEPTAAKKFVERVEDDDLVRPADRGIRDVGDDPGVDRTRWRR